MGANKTFTIRLFGPFEAVVNGVPLTRAWHNDRLLALLVLRYATPTERAWLSAALWPEAEEANARFYLRRTLASLRQVLGTQAGRLLAPASRTLQLDLSGVDCDLLGFDTALQRGDLASLEAAVALYRGPLLEGWYDEWALLDREAREQRYLDTLEALARDALARQVLEKAMCYLRALLAIEPLRETAQRAFMEALARQGDYAGMMQAYRDFRLLLHEQMRAEPSADTTALYRYLRAEARESAQPLPRPRVLSASSPPTVPETVRGQLPHPFSSLIGREQEIETVLDYLASARLVTLTGAGGIGKTRLAIAAAEQVANDYPDGVRFVDFTPLSDPTLIPQAIAALFGLREEPGRSLTETLQDFLLHKSLLLVLDNCEHLVDECAHVTEALLLACPRLRVLATSREPLRIPGERLWRVPSLSLPPEITFSQHKNALTLLLDYDAPRLFMERAEWNNADFRLTPPQVDTVAQICMQLDGIPLAIELAAAQTRALSLEEIAAHLDDHLRLLRSGSRTLPRQETLRATLDWSYGLLSDEEQELLQELSVFAGGCTLEAAEAVCGEDEETEDE